MKLKDYQPSEPATVSCNQDGEKSTLVFVRTIRHAPEKVWSAMTDARKIPKWAPFEPSRDLESVGPVTLKMIDGSTPENYESEVLQVTPPRLLEYSWGDSGVLRWELQPIEAGTRLTLQHTVNNPDWIVPAAAGWHICLDFAELLLDGHAIGPLLAEDVMAYGWEDLAAHYGKVLERNSKKPG